jgi:phage/plasmid primase-like uncharacterized protein
MVASVGDKDGNFKSIHRTYLRDDGKGKADVSPNKMMLGATKGFSVHLAKAGEVLAVCEGIETGLSVQEMFNLPTWAAMSAGGLEQLVLPALPLAQEVLIACDKDEVGLQSGEKAAWRFMKQGRQVRMALPEGNDFNDNV